MSSRIDGSSAAGSTRSGTRKRPDSTGGAAGVEDAAGAAAAARTPAPPAGTQAAAAIRAKANGRTRIGRLLRRRSRQRPTLCPNSARGDRHDVVVGDAIDELVEGIDPRLARLLVDDDLDRLVTRNDAALLERQHPALGRRVVGLLAEHPDVDPVVLVVGGGLLPLAVGAELGRRHLETDDVLAVVALRPGRLRRLVLVQGDGA